MRAPRTVVAAPANATAAAYAPTVRGVRQATARTTAPAGAPITVTALQIRLRADASTLMSGYRRIAIHLTGDDGRPVAGPDLFTWAGIPLRERTEDLRRHLTVEVGGHGNSQLCVASFDDAAAWLTPRELRARPGG